MFVVYDSTFDGLLSAAAYCLRRNLKPLALISELEPRPILDTVTISSETNIRRLFKRHLAKVLGQTAGEIVLDTVFRAFLSETEGIATRIWQYLALSLELRQDPADRLYEPAVADVVSAARRVSGQAHQYLGLLRFHQVGSSFYVADFSPDYHVLPLIVPHFADRLSDQHFAIRDLRRNLAAYHPANGPVTLHILADDWTGDSIAAGQPENLLLLETEDHYGEKNQPAVTVTQSGEDGFVEMWKLYLKRLSIPERRNPALQRANMPKKYWKYLDEKWMQ